MRFKNVPVILVLVCLLSFSACTKVDRTVHASMDSAMVRISQFAEDVGETFSVRSLEKRNQSFIEPLYVTWQTARPYYDALSDKEKLAYRCVYNGIFGQPERISVPMLKTEELDAVFSALRYDNPQLLFVGNEATLLTAGMYCYFVPTYTMSYWDARNTIEQVAAKVREVLTGLAVDANEYETLLYLHDYLCDFCSYEEQVNASQCNGALLDAKATCAGYAKALKLMLDMVGIESCAVTGSVNENGTAVNHMWLAVCLNGTWSFCDPTWDDPVSDDGRQTVEHGYFCISEERLALTHNDIRLPSHIVCNSDAYDYYVNENLLCTQENYRSVLSEALSDALQNGKDFAELRFASAEVFDEATKSLLDDGEVYTLLKDLSYLREDLNTRRIGYALDEKRLQLKLIFSFEE